MTRPQGTVLKRAGYGRSFWVTEAQDDVLTLVLLRNRAEGLTFSRLAQEALALYVPLMYGLPWPVQTRLRRPSERTGPRHWKRGMTPYGLRFNVEQDKVLQEIMGRYGVDFAALLEDAFEMYLPVQWGKVWPRCPERQREQRRRRPEPISDRDERRRMP